MVLKETCVYKKYGKEVESEVIVLSFDFVLAECGHTAENWNSMLLSVKYAPCKPSCLYVLEVLKDSWSVRLM
jgi:hypothetical protein